MVCRLIVLESILNQFLIVIFVEHCQSCGPGCGTSRQKFNTWDIIFCQIDFRLYIFYIVDYNSVYIVYYYMVFIDKWQRSRFWYSSELPYGPYDMDVNIFYVNLIICEF